MLTSAQTQRYARNLLIPGFGEEGQQRLAASKVCLIGLGGLGSPVALYLAAAGLGTLGLIDYDLVEPSNLQRQVLHGTPDIGRPKVQSAAERLSALNPEVTLLPQQVRLTQQNAGELLRPYDLVVEATDRFETKFLVNDVCVQIGKPFVTGGILSLAGQALLVVPGQTACLRCGVPEVPRTVPTTAELGVLGAVAGLMGCMQALEALCFLAGLRADDTDPRVRVHTIDGQTMRLRTIHLPPRAGCLCRCRQSMRPTAPGSVWPASLG